MYSFLWTTVVFGQLSDIRQILKGEIFAAFSIFGNSHKQKKEPNKNTSAQNISPDYHCLEHKGSVRAFNKTANKFFFGYL